MHASDSSAFGIILNSHMDHVRIEVIMLTDCKQVYIYKVLESQRFLIGVMHQVLESQKCLVGVMHQV